MGEEPMYPFDTQVNVVLACCIVHNHIRGVMLNDPILDLVDGELQTTQHMAHSDIVEPILSRAAEGSSHQGGKRTKCSKNIEAVNETMGVVTHTMGRLAEAIKRIHNVVNDEALVQKVEELEGVDEATCVMALEFLNDNPMKEKTFMQLSSNERRSTVPDEVSVLLLCLVLEGCEAVPKEVRELIKKHLATGKIRGKKQKKVDAEALDAESSDDKDTESDESDREMAAARLESLRTLHEAEEACQSTPNDHQQLMVGTREFFDAFSSIQCKDEQGKEERSREERNNDDVERSPKADSTRGSCGRRRGKEGDEGTSSKRKRHKKHITPTATPVAQLPMHLSFASQESMDQADMAVAKFMYDAGIPFNAANSFYFQLMADAIAAVGPGYKMPSYHSLRGKQSAISKAMTRGMYDPICLEGMEANAGDWIEDPGAFEGEDNGWMNVTVASDDGFTGNAKLRNVDYYSYCVNDRGSVDTKGNDGSDDL
ncbi:hypothetical protein HHK36_017978 [Tetracentron sinense]|uniref:Nuclease HARBI1 n=1 Tax=Tetracentron sinense TaxID=13715 RepID=A0A835DAV1_TETSI|nr:hypothetical protein HHK36_017978 [Tetracentron sinense]